MNGRPLSARKLVQLLVLLTLLAWATQTLLAQWGYGADLTIEPPSPSASRAAERFVPALTGQGGAALQLRSEATVFGAEVRLRQVCRWRREDEAAFLPVADLVVLRFDAASPYKSLTIDELKAILAGAKVNLGAVKLSGPLLCTCRRTDAPAQSTDALQQWINAREAGQGESPAAGKTPPTPFAVAPSAVVPSAEAVSGSTESPKVEAAPVRSLRQMLMGDLALRLHLLADSVELRFNPKDDWVLNLCEPNFRFDLRPVRVRNLGEVSWDVLLVHGGGSQKASIDAVARAWRTEAAVVKPISARQVIRDDDLIEQRTLADRLLDEPLLARSQIVGQQAARDLKPGALFTARTVEAVPLAKPGQYISVTFSQGAVRVKTAGRAMEGGSFGQSIRVKNEATNDVYSVRLTGPQEGELGPAAGETSLASNKR